MNYLQAKAVATNRARKMRIDQVISFDGVNYSVHHLPKYNGNITEVIKFSKPKKSSHAVTKKKKDDSPAESN